MEVDDPMPPPNMVFEEAEIRSENRDEYDASRPSKAAAAAAAVATTAAAASLNEDDDDHDGEDGEGRGGKRMDLDDFSLGKAVGGGNDVKEGLMERVGIDEPDLDVLIDHDIRFRARAETALERPQEGDESRRVQQLQAVEGFKRLFDVEHPQEQRDTRTIPPGSILPEDRGGVLLSADNGPMGSSLPAPTASKPKGGSVGRRRGKAQHNRKAKSKPSKTGVSLLQKDGGSIHVVECFADANCTGVFTNALLVNKNLGSHLEKAHGYTREQLADPDALKRYECSCPQCVELRDAGTRKLVDPKTVFRHLAKTSEPAPEAKMRLDSSASLSGISNKLASVSAKIKENGKNPLPPALGAELTSLWSEALAVVPECITKLGVHLPTGAPLRPVILSFAIKRTTTGKLQMMFACPSTCQDYLENGLRLPRSYRDRHKAPCHPDNASAFLRCIVSSDCTSKFERTLFTPPNLEKHSLEEHGGLERLCNPRETTRLGGRLAVLPKKVLDQIGDRWADLEHKDEMGSPYRNSKNNEVYFFSTQVTHGDGGELVIQPGYTLASLTEAKFAGGQAAAATAAAPAAATVPPAAASTSGAAAAAAASAATAPFGKKKTPKNKKTKKSDKVPAVGPAAAAVGSTSAPLQAAVSRHSQTAESVLAGGNEQGAAAAGEQNTCATVSRICPSGAAPAASPVSNRRSPDAENMQRGDMAAVVAGVGRDGSRGGSKGGEGLGQSNRPRRWSLSRLSLRQRNAKSPARANSEKDSPQVRARSSMSLDRTSAASPLRDSVRSPARDATLHASRDSTGGDSGTTLSPSPPSAPTTAAATVVDFAAISGTPEILKRKIAVDSKSPVGAPPRKVQTRG